MNWKEITKRFAYLFCAHWAREAVQAGFMLYLARKSPELYGQFIFAMSFGYILRFGSEFGINQHLAEMISRNRQDAGRSLLQVTYIKIGLLLLSSLMFTAYILFQGYSPQQLSIIFCIALGIGLEALPNSVFVLLQVEGRQDVEARMRSFAAVLGFGYGLAALALDFPVVLIALFKPLETATCLVGTLVGAARKRLFDDAAPLSLGEILRKWKTTIDFTAIALCAILFNKLNMLMLERFHGPEALAQYSASWQLIDGVSIFVSGMLLGKVIYPVIIAAMRDNKGGITPMMREFFSWLALAGFAVSFVMAMESAPLILTLYGEQYRPATLLQPVLAGCAFFAFVHNYCSYIIMAAGEVKKLKWLYAAGLAANIALCSAFIPAGDGMGASWAILATKGCMACLTVGYCQKKYGILTNRKNLFTFAAIILSLSIFWIANSRIPHQAAIALALAPLPAAAFFIKRRSTTTTVDARGDQPETTMTDTSE